MSLALVEAPPARRDEQGRPIEGRLECPRDILLWLENRLGTLAALDRRDVPGLEVDDQAPQLWEAA